MGREEEESKTETRTCDKPNNVGYPNQQSDVAVVDAQQEQNKVERFCFVNIRPKDALDAKSIIQDAVKLFEEMDQRLLQISEYLRQKAIDREDVISRLEDLQNDRLNGIVDGKKDLLTHLYMSLDAMSFPKSCSISQLEKLQKHKLNFRMQHKMKNLTQEKQLVRDINEGQERNNSNNDDSTLPMQELSDILCQIQWRYQYHRHYNKNKCEKLVEEIKQFQETRKISKVLRETVRNQVKVICDELMEMSKEKRALDAKIQVAKKEIEAINEEIWSFHQKNFKDKHLQRKEASVFFLKNTGFNWIFKSCNLENDSIHKNTIYARDLDQVMSIFTARFPR